MIDSSKPVICPKCGWNHFGVDREYAEQQSKEFLEWWLTQTPEVQQCYGEQQTYEKLINNYENCFRCDTPYQDLYIAEGYTTPIGSTLQPIIFPDQ